MMAECQETCNGHPSTERPEVFVFSPQVLQSQISSVHSSGHKPAVNLHAATHVHMSSHDRLITARFCQK